MKQRIRFFCLALVTLVAGMAAAQNVAKVGTTEYATIEEAIEAWGPGKTLTLLDNVTTTSTVIVEVNATKSTQNWTLDLGDYTWTANGCNAIHLFAAGGTPIHQNYGLKINANQSGGITASGKYAVYYTNQGTCSDSRGYRPRLEINGGTYNASFVVYYGTSAWSSTPNGASVFLNKSADGTEPVFNGNFGLSKCPVTVNAGYFNGTIFTAYRVSTTVEPNIFGGHFKTYSAFPTESSNKGLVFGNYKVFVRSDASIDMTNGAPATYEAKATKTLLLNSNQGVNYSDYIYYEKANDAIQKYSSGTIEIVLAQGVTATESKSFSSGTLTIDASAEGASYTGNITLTGNNAKFIVKFPEGSGHYGVSVSSGGTLHVEESVADGIVTRTYSRIGNVSDPEAKVGDTGYSTVYDAFYAIDGTTDNKTIVLQRDVTNAGIVTNGTATGGDGKTVATFDLNGKSIGIGSVAAGNNADYTLTIIDSSQDKTGTVTNSDASLFILALTGINDYSGSYTLKIQAGTWQFDPSNVVINGVTHNLVDEGYAAKDNGNGTWTVGEVAYVAQIGTKKYISLAAAVSEAQANDVITMIADDNVSLTAAGSEITINKPLTITGAVDDNGKPLYTIYGSSNGALSNSSFNDLFLSCSTGTVTVSNVKFDGFGNEISSVMGHSPVFIGSSNNNAVIENVYISKLNCEGIHINGGTFTIKDCNIDCSKAANSVFTKGICVVNDAQGTIENTTITGVDCDDPNDTSAAIELQGSGDVSISGCTIETETIGIATTPVGELTAGTSQVTISDCTITSHNIAIYSNGDKGALTSISSGRYSGLLMAGDNDEGLSISGGIFDDEPAQAYCAEGFGPAENTDPATSETYPYTVQELPDVAQIGEDKYKSLQAAVDAAHEMTGDVTVTLLTDITEYAIVHQKAGLNLTIDGDDKTVNGQIIVDGNGRASGTETLTIQNIKFEGNTSDFISASDDAFILIPSTKATGKPYTTGGYNYAHNITVSSCLFTSTSETFNVVGVKAPSGAGAYNVVITECTGTNLHSLTQLTGTTGGSVTKNTVTSSESFMNVNGGGGEFIVSENTFTSAEGADGYGIRENAGSSAVITLTDNTFNAAKAVVLGKGGSATNGTINVVSGTYVGDIVKDIAATATGKIAISGGQFSAPVGDAEYAGYFAEGLCGVNGLYEEPAPNGVGTAVATVTLDETTIKFATFEAAVDAATSGETIELLANITDAYTMSEGQTLKVKKNGFSVTIKAPEGFILISSTPVDGVITYTIVEPDLMYTDANGTVSYKAWSNTVISTNGTYKLLKDVTASARIVPGMMISNVTLDLNGFTLTSTATDAAFSLTRAGTAASPKVFNIVNTSENGDGKVVVNPEADKAIEINGNYNNVTIGGGVTIDGGCVAVLKNNDILTVEGTINGGDDFAIVTNGGTTTNATITIKNGAVLTSNSVAMYLPGTGTTTIEEGAKVTGTTGIYVKSATLNIEGGEITGNGPAAEYAYNKNGCNSTGQALVVDNCNYPGGAPTVNITGGIFTTANNESAIGSYAYGDGAEAIGEFVHGGYFSTELPRELCEAGKKTVPSTTVEGYYELGEVVFVAQIGDVKYETLEEAWNAVNDGEKITLLANCEGNGLIAPQGKFTNGLTVDFASFTYSVTGNLVGSSGTETQAFQLLKDNKITFKNGTVYSEKALFLVQNYSDLTLEGMTLTLNNANYAQGYTLSNNNGNIVIDGSTINANPAGSFAFDVCRNSSYPSVSVTVKGESVINGDIEVSASGSDAKDGFELMFESASLNGEIVLDESAKTAMAATPDKAKVSKNNSLTDIAAPADYKWKDNGDGTSTLVPCEYICAIGTTKYETLADAVAAAGTSATTITLLTEAATDGVISGDGVVVPSGSNITFDLNGLTYDVSGETVGSSGTETSGFQLLQGSDITFKNGTLKATSPTAQLLIQNYSNLTLEDVNLDGTGLSGMAYALSNNCGTINLTGSTSITAKEGGRAFDTCKFGNYTIPTVNINTTGVISGPIEATGGKLNIENGKFNVTWVTDNNYAAGDIQIKGGVFTAEVAEEYCAEGFVCTDNDDPTYKYTVKTKEEAGIFELLDLLSKKTPYTYDEDHEAEVITYKREFSQKTAGHRQCWFVPFDYTITANDVEKHTFYKLHMFDAENIGEDGSATGESVVMTIMEVGEGYTLKANMPYIIKPKEKGVYEFVAKNTTLKAKDNDVLKSMSTTMNRYDIFGVYDSYGPTEPHKWFSMNTDGNLMWNQSNQALKMYRWYIVPEYVGDDYSKFTFSFIEDDDKDETTLVNKLLVDSDNEIEGIYTVGGAKLDNPIKGINIIRYTDGRTKKIYVK